MSRILRNASRLLRNKHCDFVFYSYFQIIYLINDFWEIWSVSWKQIFVAFINKDNFHFNPVITLKNNVHLWELFHLFRLFFFQLEQNIPYKVHRWWIILSIFGAVRWFLNNCWSNPWWGFLLLWIYVYKAEVDCNRRNISEVLFYW